MGRCLGRTARSGCERTVRGALLRACSRAAAAMLLCTLRRPVGAHPCTALLKLLFSWPADYCFGELKFGGNAQAITKDRQVAHPLPAVVAVLAQRPA